jgi:hypothetical protein
MTRVGSQRHSKKIKSQWYFISSELLEESREVPTVSLLRQAERCQGFAPQNFIIRPDIHHSTLQLSRIHCHKNNT